MLKSPEDAFILLERLGAPQRLVKHLELVGEAGGEVISKLDDLGVQYDKRFVQVGIALHDAGKIVHPNELEKGGNLHEAAGEKLLLENGVDAEIAQCCRSHSQYASMSVSFEELIIALADTLWKGSRKADLELRIIDGVAARLQTDRWELFRKRWLAPILDCLLNGIQLGWICVGGFDVFKSIRKRENLRRVI